MICSTLAYCNGLYTSHTVLNLCTFVAQYPFLADAINQLLALLIAGATTHEVTVALTQWSVSVRTISHVLIQLLYVTGGVLAYFKTQIHYHYAQEDAATEKRYG